VNDEPKYESWREAIAKGAVMAFVALVIIIIGLTLIVRVGGNMLSHANPPATCQLLGGSWSWWSGWSCG
jgi:hypothetical protein